MTSNVYMPYCVHHPDLMIASPDIFHLYSICAPRGSLALALQFKTCQGGAQIGYGRER